MKICSIIAEYNPFHNGHLSQINYIKANLKPDFIAVFLSGNFTQRGEGAVLDKFTRARHAVLAGADIVFELPAVFATQSAEFFASGAVKLINSLPGEKTVCFGSECGDKTAILDIANAMLNESQEYKKIIKTELKKGVSLIKAKQTALSLTNKDLNVDILKSPNNVLGIEYVKAIVKNKYDINVEVIKRNGADYNSEVLTDSENPSALAIRNAIISGNLVSVKNFVPPFTFSDLPNGLVNFDREIIYSLISATKTQISKSVDCEEGLENRIKSLLKENATYDSLIKSLKTKRYTEKRLKRIMLSTMLSIDEKLIKKALNKPLYLKILAINKNAPNLLSYISKAKYPLLTRKSDVNKLDSTALKVFLKDVYCNDIYSAVVGTKTNENNMLII